MQIPSKITKNNSQGIIFVIISCQRVSLFYLRLVFVAYGQLAWSLFYLRVTFGLVFFAYGGKLVWSFLLTVPPWPEIRFGLFLLTVPPVRKLGLVSFAYGSLTVSKKDEP